MGISFKIRAVIAVVALLCIGIEVKLTKETTTQPS
jgi:hypothetical protein